MKFEKSIQTNGGIKEKVDEGFKKYLKLREKMMAEDRKRLWNRDIIYWKDL